MQLICLVALFAATTTLQSESLTMAFPLIVLPCFPCRRYKAKLRVHPLFPLHASSSPDRDDPQGFESEPSLLSDDDWRALQDNQPSQWMVMKELLGINGFTYVLAALISIMLTLNFVLGPGWLGQSIGIKGTGTFTEVSANLPDTIDLSADEYLFTE